MDIGRENPAVTLQGEEQLQRARTCGLTQEVLAEGPQYLSVSSLPPPQEVDAQMLRDVCSKYFYDQCPAVAGYGK